MMYHEAALVNLLEIVFYNKEACLSCEETLLDLVDYCAQKVNFLNSWTDDSSTKTAQEILKMSDEEVFLLC